jgi:TctA family transporter
VHQQFLVRFWLFLIFRYARIGTVNNRQKDFLWRLIIGIVVVILVRWLANVPLANIIYKVVLIILLIFLLPVIFQMFRNENKPMMSGKGWDKVEIVFWFFAALGLLLSLF